MIAAAAGAIVARYPFMTAKAAKSAATKAWKVGGWQAVAAIYAIQTNPQRPIDIPGPVNVGWTPREEQLINYLVPRIKDFGGMVREDLPTFEGPLVGGLKEGPIFSTASVKAKPKKVSKFNRAISAGMKKVKSSSSYGKKGTISSAKKAFSAVTKTVAGLGKRKTPSKGIKRAIATTPAAKIYKDEILRRKMK